MIRRIFWYVRAARMLPYLPVFLACRARSVVTADMARWSEALGVAAGLGASARFLDLMVGFPEFRSLFYHRARVPRPAQLLASGMPTLFLNAPEIGPGLVIQHGFATILFARAVGRDCWINQQVTVGAADERGPPTIGNGVRIGAGAKVLGRFHVGDGAVIGANAVVVKEVPPGCTVAGVPARIVRREGRRVDEPL